MELPIYCWRPSSNRGRRQKMTLAERVWHLLEGLIRNPAAGTLQAPR